MFNIKNTNFEKKKDNIFLNKKQLFQSIKLNDLNSKFIKMDARLNIKPYINKYHKRFFKKKESEISPKQIKISNYNPHNEFKNIPDLYFLKYKNLTYNKLKKHHLKLYYLNFQNKKNLDIYNFIKYKNIYNNNNTINLYIKKTKNNLFITIYTKKYINTKTITNLGFKGRSKQSQYAYKMFAENITESLLNLKEKNPNFINLDIFFCNQYNRRIKSILQHINTIIKISNIYNKTSIPFNGCRKRKISIRKKRKSIVKFLSY